MAINSVEIASNRTLLFAVLSNTMSKYEIRILFYL